MLMKESAMKLFSYVQTSMINISHRTMISSAFQGKLLSVTQQTERTSEKWLSAQYNSRSVVAGTTVTSLASKNSPVLNCEWSTSDVDEWQEDYADSLMHIRNFQPAMWKGRARDQVCHNDILFTSTDARLTSRHYIFSGEIFSYCLVVTHMRSLKRISNAIISNNDVLAIMLTTRSWREVVWRW